MMIGIDGDMWYCSNGLPLPHPNANYTFERTLRQAVDKYHDEFKSHDTIQNDMVRFLDSTPEEYLSYNVELSGAREKAKTERDA